MTIELGYGYNRLRKQDKSLRVFSPMPEPKIVGKKQCKYIATMCHSWDDYQRKISGNSKINIPANAINIKAAFDGTHSQYSTQEEVIYIIHIFAVHRVEELQFGTEAPVPTSVIEVLKSEPDQFYAQYGDSYISSVAHGKEVAITIRFTEISDEAKTLLKGMFGAILQHGVGEEQLISLDTLAKKKKLKYEIQAFTTGVMLKAPPITTNFSELEKWVKTFESEFNTTSHTDVGEELYYTTNTYEDVLKDSYFLINKIYEMECLGLLLDECRTVVSYCMRYYRDVDPNSSQLADFSSKQLIINAIKFELDGYNGRSTKTQEFQQLLIKLRQMVVELRNFRFNPIKIGTSYDSSQFKEQWDPSTDSTPWGTARDNTPRYRSPRFLFDFSQFKVEHFSFEISRPIKGNLVFIYQLSDRCSYKTLVENINETKAAPTIAESNRTKDGTLRNEIWFSLLCITNEDIKSNPFNVQSFVHYKQPPSPTLDFIVDKMLVAFTPLSQTQVTSVAAAVPQPISQQAPKQPSKSRCSIM